MYSKQNFSFVDFKLLDWKCIGIFFWSLWVILSGITLWSLWVILSVSPFDLYEWYCQYHPLISMSDIVIITLWSQWVILSVSPFDLYEWYCQYQQTHSDTEKYQSVWRHNMMFNTDKKNNVSFEGLLYHSSSYELAQILVIMSVSSSKLLLFYIIFFRQEWMELKDHVLTN